jgi:hypothetical protein
MHKTMLIGILGDAKVTTGCVNALEYRGARQLVRDEK